MPSRQEALGARLREQVAALIGAGAPVPEDRLAAELAMLAVKIDVTEEIDRLKSHCVAADAATCRKRVPSAASSIFSLRSSTARPIHSVPRPPMPRLRTLASRLKAAIDQFREQAQNVEETSNRE